MTEKKTLKNIVETLERRVNDIREDFNDLKAEMTRRFGPRNDDEIFRALPKAQALDVPLQTVLMNRRSERSFSDEPISDQVLSALLHAADGINRADGKRTTLDIAIRNYVRSAMRYLGNGGGELLFPEDVHFVK